MKFSIVTVCLNSADTIIDTIESVAEQTHPMVEHVIFDGGSTDGTVAKVKKYGSAIRLVQGKDSGIYDAMNKGISLCSGEFIGILNSDDVYAHKDVLTEVAAAFEEYNTDAVYGDLLFVRREEPEKVYRYWKSGTASNMKFQFGWTIPHPTLFLKASVYKQYGLYNANFQLAGDYEFILRLFRKHNASTAYLPKTLVKMKGKGKSGSSLFQRLRFYHEIPAAWRSNGLSIPILAVVLKPMRKLHQFTGPLLLRRK